MSGSLEICQHDAIFSLIERTKYAGGLPGLSRVVFVNSISH